MYLVQPCLEELDGILNDTALDYLVGDAVVVRIAEESAFVLMEAEKLQADLEHYISSVEP